MHHVSVFVLEYIIIVIQNIFSNHNIHQINAESVNFLDTSNTLTISKDKSGTKIELYCAVSMVLG